MTRLDSRRKGIVHIGLPKTGTTTIQNALHLRRADLLSEAGILYPGLEPNHTTPLCTMFLDDPTTHITNKLAGLRHPEDIRRAVDGYFKAFEKEIHEAEWSTLLLSAEGLSNLKAGEVRKLKSWLERFAPGWRVVVWVRHPVDMTRSVMQQLVKGGNTLEQLTAEPILPNFRGKLSNWLTVFGRESMEVIHYESASASPDGITGAFARGVGIEDGLVHRIAEAAAYENRAMSHEAVHLLSSLNRQRPLLDEAGVGPHRTGNELRAIQQIPGRRFEIDAATLDKIRKESQADVQWLNTTFGLSLYTDIFEEGESTILDEKRPALNSGCVDYLALLLSDLMNKIHFQNQMSKGNQALQKLDLEAALAHYNEANRVLPDSAAAKGQIDAVKKRQRHGMLKRHSGS